VLGRSEECPKRNPQGGSLFLRERERERARERRKEETLVGLENKGVACFIYSPRPKTHPCAAPTDSPRCPRGRSARCADGPAPRHGQSVICSRTSSTAPLPTSRADSPRRPGGRSARSGRIVRPTAADCPTFLFFSA
jgi:hypothetical protein